MATRTDEARTKLEQALTEVTGAFLSDSRSDLSELDAYEAVVEALESEREILQMRLDELRSGKA
jgi:hypothetical protein